MMQEMAEKHTIPHNAISPLWMARLTILSGAAAVNGFFRGPHPVAETGPALKLPYKSFFMNIYSWIAGPGISLPKRRMGRDFHGLRLILVFSAAQSRFVAIRYAQ